MPPSLEAYFWFVQLTAGWGSLVKLVIQSRRKSQGISVCWLPSIDVRCNVRCKDGLKHQYYKSQLSVWMSILSCCLFRLKISKLILRKNMLCILSCCLFRLKISKINIKEKHVLNLKFYIKTNCLNIQIILLHFKKLWINFLIFE